MLYRLILVVQVISALAIIVLVLLQQGKGADAGAAFGSGGSGASSGVFGASGSGNFLAKVTAGVAAVFFLATLAMAYFGPYRAPSQNAVMEKLQSSKTPAKEQKPEVPVQKDMTGSGAVPGAVPGAIPGASSPSEKGALGTVPEKK
ncbi:MAG: preprotein translocase subunit SecG [Oxalobacter sp.]